LEAHFERVRANLPPNIDCTVWSCPFDSRGFWPRLLDGLAAVRHQGEVNHILGDVHFLALFLGGARTLLNVADCVSLHCEKGLRRALLKYLWYVLPVRRVRLVSTISEATRQELLSLLKCNPSKVRVVHVCILDRFRPAPRPFKKECPTILQVGTSRNKNLGRLAEALSGLQCKLHIVGPVAPDQAEALKRFGVSWTGGGTLRVEEVLAAYENADVVAFPSTYEGFGMPIVEANTVERVVVAGDIPALREVGADAACFVDPLDPASIRRGIVRVIEDDAYREILIENGRMNRQRFSAARIAAQYAELYGILADGTEGKKTKEWSKREWGGGHGG
jgi:glycosyltransferase involved in cell wall biosynthesis